MFISCNYTMYMKMHKDFLAGYTYVASYSKAACAVNMVIQVSDDKTNTLAFVNFLRVKILRHTVIGKTS